MSEKEKPITNSKPIPPIPLPFEEVMRDVLKVRPPTKTEQPKKPTANTKKAKTPGH